MNLSLTRLQSYLLLLVVVLVAGTAGMMAAEDLSPFEAFYFIVVTIATVGYGDISPATTAGRALAIVLIVAGVGTFVAVFANIVEGLLSREERRAHRRKVNMIIGTFFAEFGNRMLAMLAESDPAITAGLPAPDRWGAKDAARIRKALTTREFSIDPSTVDFTELKKFLAERRGFLLSLLQHPAIFEHDTFTELLRAFFHLAEEVGLREDVERLPPADLAHLAGDISRGYRLLLLEWVSYMDHLREHYPYLFSLAVRTNPLDPDASPTIR